MRMQTVAGWFLVVSMLVIFYLQTLQKFNSVDDSIDFNKSAVNDEGGDKCSCSIRHRWTINNATAVDKSVCSAEADERGAGQNVVAYSLFGRPGESENILRRYFSSLQSRAERVAQVYPGWIMRIYHNLTGEDYDKFLCPLRCQYSHVDLCQVNGIQSKAFANLNPRMWRFLVMLDPLVDRFMSRDIDSDIIDREKAAVKHWIESNYTFHVMRDHPSHGGFMLAGLWGAKNVQRRDLIRRLGWMMTMTSQNDRYETDQNRLDLIVWPFATFDVMAHDAYFCSNWLVKLSQMVPTFPFPTQRVGRNYTGYDLVRKDIADSIKPCPVDCRPNDHKNWLFC